MRGESSAESSRAVHRFTVVLKVQNNQCGTWEKVLTGNRQRSYSNKKPKMYGGTMPHGNAGQTVTSWAFSRRDRGERGHEL